MVAEKGFLMLGGSILLSYVHREGYFDATPRRDGLSPQIFSHRRTDTGEVRHFDVLGLYFAALTTDAPVQRVTVDLDAGQVAWIRQHGGIEDDHLAAMGAGFLEQPGLLLTWDDGTSTVIDGNHRYVRRHQLGMPEMRFFLFTEALTRPWLVSVPEEVSSAMLNRPGTHREWLRRHAI